MGPDKQRFLLSVVALVAVICYSIVQLCSSHAQPSPSSLAAAAHAAAVAHAATLTQTLSQDQDQSYLALPCQPLPPLACRDDIIVAAEARARTRVAAEIGVNEGWFAAKNLAHWSGKYMMVDAWGHRPGDKGMPDLNSPDDKTHLARYNAMLTNTAQWASQRDIRKGLSTTVASTVADGSLDAVYIDALHTYEAVLDDLRAWAPKVRACGIVSGDDYGDYLDTPGWTAARGEKVHGNVARNHQWGTIRAVQEYAASIGADVHVTFANDCKYSERPYPFRKYSS